MRRVILLFGIVGTTILNAAAQHSVARQWNEVLLESIRNDFARPNVHARNLFHTSAAMYDAWAAYDDQATTYFLGKEINGTLIQFEGVETPSDILSAREEAISYATYRLIRHRFKYSPGFDHIYELADNLMNDLQYDQALTSFDYSDGKPSSLGNYIAEQIIAYGLEDGSREALDYSAAYYEPFNSSMTPDDPGSQGCEDPNRWQPLSFETFIDQSGNEIPASVPEFLGPEWGNVVPFSLTEEDKSVYERDGHTYNVYNDPGAPAYMDPTNDAASDDYKWGHLLVALWSAHLDPADQEMWDISPGAIGNLKIENFPTTHAGLKDFYDQMNGGDPSSGYEINPVTNQPYEPQLVPRADYGRVLAEFWADGPDSETPPGHWFTILNYVNDHPELVKKYRGEGDVVGDLEWDIKSYFVLGGAMHDAAVSAWSIKGYYDYTRPISAIRYMADHGQSSDPDKANYSQAGIPLIDGYVQLVEEGDALAGDQNENVGKIKLYAWRGPDFIADPETDYAGVGWILAENWWPYQRPTFVTPPFAGYVSGHSTYSRAAARVLSEFTGDEYFPGGVGEFQAPKNEFLVFEQGPSVDVTLQWAKYYDASDQCSLSRIWGGIHPPVDDIPGRLIGDKIGQSAFRLSEKYFDGSVVLNTSSEPIVNVSIFPNPVQVGGDIIVKAQEQLKSVRIHGLDGATVFSKNFRQMLNQTTISSTQMKPGIYILEIETHRSHSTQKIVMR